MIDLRAYILSVCGAAIVSAVISRFLGSKSGSAGISKLLIGIFLVLTILGPIVSLDIRDANNLTLDMDMEAEAAVQRGEEVSHQALSDNIKSRTGAYILQKAQSLGLNITVDVTVSDQDIPIPCGVHISGNASPYAKQRLMSMIQQQLGIAKENLIWT